MTIPTNTPDQSEKKSKRLVIILIALLAIVALVIAAFYFFQPKPAPVATPKPVAVKTQAIPVPPEQAKWLTVLAQLKKTAVPDFTCYQAVNTKMTQNIGGKDYSFPVASIVKGAPQTYVYLPQRPDAASMKMNAAATLAYSLCSVNVQVPFVKDADGYSAPDETKVAAALTAKGITDTATQKNELATTDTAADVVKTAATMSDTFGKASVATSGEKTTITPAAAVSIAFSVPSSSAPANEKTKALNTVSESQYKALIALGEAVLTAAPVSK